MIKNANLLLLSIAVAFLCTQAIASNIRIERYDKSRDFTAISQILAQDPSLTYEALGQPKGTTEKYLESKRYTTDVLLEDGKTVGFINYCAYNFEFLTFHINRRGLINIIGVDEQHRRRGHGRRLLTHAIAELQNLKVPAIQLFVKPANAVARGLYESTGFSCPTREDLRKVLPHLTSELKLDVPAKDLPQGNIIQRYPKTALVLAGVAAWYAVWRR